MSKRNFYQFEFFSSDIIAFCNIFKMLNFAHDTILAIIEKFILAILEKKS